MRPRSSPLHTAGKVSVFNVHICSPPKRLIWLLTTYFSDGCKAVTHCHNGNFTVVESHNHPPDIDREEVRFVKQIFIYFLDCTISVVHMWQIFQIHQIRSTVAAAAVADPDKRPRDIINEARAATTDPAVFAQLGAFCFVISQIIL